MAYRIRYEKWGEKRGEAPILGKGQVLCALILYGVIFGGMLSGLGTETIREVFLPTQMEVIAGSYAMGVSSRQIFVEQCRQLLRTGDIYD